MNEQPERRLTQMIELLQFDSDSSSSAVRRLGSSEIKPTDFSERADEHYKCIPFGLHTELGIIPR